MNILLIGILIILIVLTILIVILLYKKQANELSAKFDALLKEQFLTFQSNVHKELNTTREEVVRSKDLIAEYTIKTIDTMKDMGATIHKIIQQQEEAQKLGQSLRDILQTPKLRGSYGEVILEEMLKRVLPKGIWERQYSIDGREKVDAIIRVKDIIIPVDAKFPRDDYQKYLETSSPQEKLKYWKDFETAVKNQIKSISTKYIKPDMGTSDFAIMFIPSEAIYYETIAEKNYLGEASLLYEYAQENKVIPVSPNTFYAFLQIIIISIRNLEIVKSVKMLQEGLTTLQKTFESFYEQYEEIGKYINKAEEAFHKGDKYIKSYKKNLDKTLQLEEFHKDSNALPKGTLKD